LQRSEGELCVVYCGCRMHGGVSGGGGGATYKKDPLEVIRLIVRQLDQTTTRPRQVDKRQLDQTTTSWTTRVALTDLNITANTVCTGNVVLT
jgi:hypothetical protein